MRLSPLGAGTSGDGSDSSTEQNPVHTYASEAQYRVTLRVTDNEDAAGSVFRTSPSKTSHARTPRRRMISFPARSTSRMETPSVSRLARRVTAPQMVTPCGSSPRLMRTYSRTGCHAPKDIPIWVNDGNLFLCPMGSCPVPLYIAITLGSDDANRIAPSVHQEAVFRSGPSGSRTEDTRRTRTSPTSTI
jgi:PKD repeat protein